MLWRGCSAIEEPDSGSEGQGTGSAGYTLQEARGVLVHRLPLQTLEAVKRKQFEKYHAAAPEERATIERNPYTIFHQALKNCEPVIGLVPILKGGHFYQVSGQTGEGRAARGCNKAGGGVLVDGRAQSRPRSIAFWGPEPVRIWPSESRSVKNGRQNTEENKAVSK